MPSYFVDDGGDNSDGSTWAKAYTSIAALVSAVANALTTSGNIIYIGDDHVDSVTGANRTFTGPSSGLPVVLISADRTDNTNPPAYKIATGKSVRSDDGNYSLTFDGSFALYGLRICPGSAASPLFQADANEAMYVVDCTFVQIVNGVANLGVSLGEHFYKNLTLDLTADGTGSVRNANLATHDSQSIVRVQGLTIVGGGAWRSSTLFKNGGMLFEVSGADLSPCTGATAKVNDMSGPGTLTFTNCILPATMTVNVPSTATGKIVMSNCGAADDPTNFLFSDYHGAVLSSLLITRTGGGTIEGIQASWLVTTTANCSEYSPFHSPWMYGKVSVAAPTTFSVCITNDTAALTDAECWLEVEYLSTSNTAKWARVSDHRATITTTAAAQTTDSTSSWGGTGPAFSYKQVLSVTVTVGEEGQYRARVVVGKASIAAASNFYIDPLVTVTQ